MRQIIRAILLLTLLTACTVTPTQPPPTTSPVPTSFTLQPGESPVLISEVMAGIQGDNNFEFIELYNRSDQAVDLHGWALWYRLAASPEDLFVYRWQTTALVPPHGHYLLGHSGVTLSVAVDVNFDQALNTMGGGLQLRQTDGTVLDRLGWGKAPDDYFEGQPAAALENGLALERLPGSEQGSPHDSGSNATDFRMVAVPDPQNTGSKLTPFTDQRLEITLNAPTESAPGSSFDVTLQIRNLTGQKLDGVQAFLPIPEGLTLLVNPPESTLTGSLLTVDVGSMETGENQEFVLSLAAPWTYYTVVAANYYVQAENWPAAAFGGAVRTNIAGGVIPIATARSLLGAELTIEGTAIMYTGGYYAGTGNTKFYLQDETGAIQVQVFEGAGVVNVKIGDRVRMRGKVSIYRDSVQIVPIELPQDVEVLSSGTDPDPNPVTIQSAFEDRALLPGSLVTVEGEVSRVDEFSYSYEIDVRDASFRSLTLYVDKQTNINVEQIEPGMRLLAIGVLDTRDGLNLLYPRVQSDLEQRFPPILRVTVDAPPSVSAGAPLQFTLNAYNHTTVDQTNIVVSMSWAEGKPVEVITGTGSQTGGSELTWTIPALSANGGSSSITLQTINDQQTGTFYIQPAVRSDAEPDGTVIGSQVFVGESVPVWAIQGASYRSPYVGQILTTQGFVTGVFPSLGGFFIQTDSPDTDQSTSDGLFVLSPLKSEDELITPVKIGDIVRITGKVREPGQQTTLEIRGAPDVEILPSGVQSPDPVLLDPPPGEAEARSYYERLEGMIVSVPGPAVAVSPISKYGETVVVLSSHGINRLFQGQDNGILIMLDDGSSTTYTAGEELPYIVNSGDTLTAITGPLAYSYAMYKIEPVAPPTVNHRLITLPTLLPSSSETFSVMTWNVENLFDSRPPNPADPPLPTPRQYRLHLDKVAATIDAAGAPTIVALQEVENIEVLQSLASHDWLLEYGYEPFLLEGGDSRGIDVGYLVRTERAKIVDYKQSDSPGGVFSRPPLLLQVEVIGPSGSHTVYLLNNHFTSMSGGELATEPRRTEQAEWNAGLVAQLAAGEEQNIIVLGDLNSYFISPPIQALRQAGLQHVLDTLPAEERYTYIYQGESQVLDHILVSQALFEAIQNVTILHVNADYALPPAEDNGVLHKSDHDPVIATFLLK